MDFAELTAALAVEESIVTTPDVLAESLRGHDAIILLESTHPLGELPMLVREHEAAYHAALNMPSTCYAAVYAGDEAERRTCTFDTLAEPLLQAWHDASANADLRHEITRALGDLYILTPALEQARRSPVSAAPTTTHPPGPPHTA